MLQIACRQLSAQNEPRAYGSGSVRLWILFTVARNSPNTATMIFVNRQRIKRRVSSIVCLITYTPTLQHQITVKGAAQGLPHS